MSSAKSLNEFAFSLGASGCIFGLMGAYYISFTAYDKKLILYAIISSLVMVALSIGTNINSWAHLSGAVGGLLLGWIFIQYNKKKIQRKADISYQNHGIDAYSESSDEDEEEIEDF